jgi:glycosyltransferase involved in cell wall biosynthesis
MVNLPTKKKIHRILYVNPYNTKGGPYHSLMVLLKKLDRSHYKPLVLEAQICPSDDMEKMGIDVYHHPAIQTVPRSLMPITQFTFWLSFITQIRSLVEKIQRLNIDIVHVNSEACWIALKSAHLARVPVITHIRGMSVLHPPLIGKLSAGVLCHYSNTLLAVSNKVKDSYIKAGVSRDKIITIHNGLDIEKYHPDHVKPCLKNELGISEDQPLIGMIANIDRRKGHHDFVTMCSLVKLKFPDARFIVVGGILPGQEKYMEEVKSLATQKGLSNELNFIGYREDIPEIIQSLDIIVQPSHTEAGPRVPLEAMAMRKPLVVTNIEGNAEEVIHGETGFTVPVGDASAMAASVNMLLLDAGLRQRMGHAGRTRVEYYFTDDHYADAIQSIYKDVLHLKSRQNIITQ